MTSYQKLWQSEYINPYSQGFGESIDIHKNTAVIGAYSSDSLQNGAGLAFIYENGVSGWVKTATLSPSSSFPYQNFGIRVLIVEDIIVILSYDTEYNDSTINGNIYVYEKPLSGWEDMTESHAIPLQLEQISNAKIDINKEGNAIALYNDNRVYIYSKKGSTWSDVTSQVVIDYSDSTFTNINDISIDQNFLAVGYYKSVPDKGMVGLFKSEAGDWSAMKEIQRISKPFGNYFFGEAVKLYNNQLLVYTQSTITDSTFLYLSSNDWSTVDKEIILDSKDSLISTASRKYYRKIDMNDSIIAIGRNYELGHPAISIYKRPSGGWQNSNEDYLLDNLKYYRNRYSINLAISGTNMVTHGYFDRLERNTNGHLLFYDIGTTPLTESTVIEYKEYSSTGAWFGETVAFHDSVLAVSALHDGNTVILGGVVNLYKKDDGGDWKLITKVYPNDTTKELNFGYSIAFYKEYLIVGAPTYTEEGETRSTGAVYVFKKQENSWENVKQIAKLRPSDWEVRVKEGSGMYLSFGHAIDIEGNTIVVGAPGRNGELQDYGQIYVFEKKDGEEWQSGFESGILTVAEAGNNSRIGLNIDLYNNTIVTPENQANKDSEGLIHFFERPQDGWETSTESYSLKLPTEDKKYQGIAFGKVLLDEKYAFVGDPLYDIDTVDYAGRIFILKKTKGNWEDAEVVRQLRLQNPENQQRMGSIFSVKENIIMIATPFMNHRTFYDSKKRGRVHVIQALDHNWQETIELITLHGEKEIGLDGFGLSVDGTLDDFAIGAHLDDSKSGYQSGAAYVVPMPPTIQLMGPVCENMKTLELHAYPEGGTWSGPGIVDGTEDLFFPSLAGPGVHELTYSTPNCYYDGRIKITVEPKMDINFTHSLSPTICENDTFRLEVDSIENANYTWHCFATTDTVNKDTTTQVPYIDVVKEGNYVLEVDNGVCVQYSDTVNLRKLTNNIEIDSLPVICNINEPVILSAIPTGGEWLNASVMENKLIPSILSEGDHSLVYKVDLENTCTYQDTLNITIDPLKEIDISFDTSSYCELQHASLSASKYKNTTYVLEKLNTSEEEFVDIEQTESGTFNITKEGIYRVITRKHNCENISKEIKIDLPKDSVFIPNVITPNGDGINDTFELWIENVESTQLKVMNRKGKEIYQDDDYDNSWSGKEIPSGIYYYSIFYKTYCNPSPPPINGWLQILK